MPEPTQSDRVRRGDLVRIKDSLRHFGIVVDIHPNRLVAKVFYSNGLLAIHKEEDLERQRICDSETCGFANFQEIIDNWQDIDRAQRDRYRF